MELDIFSEGKEYISASRAAKKTGYTTDYIGQLCRAGKVQGKLIDRTWYVDFDSLRYHKKTRQLGKPRLTRNLPVLPASEKKTILKIQEHPIEIISSELFRESALEYMRDDAALLPALAKPVGEPLKDSTLVFRKSIVLATLFLVVAAGATRALPSFEQNSLSTHQVSAASIFGAFSSPLDFILSGFKNVHDIAFGSSTPKASDLSPNSQFAEKPISPPLAQSSPAPQALIEKAASFDPSALKVELKAELESYILTRIPTAEPSVVYTTTTPTLNTSVLRQEILLADTRPTLTRQSTSDVDHSSRALAEFATSGTFQNSTLTNATISGPLGDFTHLSFHLATGTSATTTSLFSSLATFDTATTTNLFANSFSLGSGSIGAIESLSVSGAGAGLTFTGSGNHDIAAGSGTLRLGASTLTGNVSPLDATISIGSVGNRFNKIYADEINANTVVGTISGGNISAESMRINSDNATVDTEDSMVEFERGTLSPNALLTWDSTNKRFTMNAPLALIGGIGNGNFLATGSTTLQNFTFISATGTAATTTNLYTSEQTILAGSTGNVGIGTTNPSQRLEVSGNALISSTNSMMFNSTTRYINANGTRLIFATDDPAERLAFQTNSNERLSILSNGNVGIGTTTPAHQLTIASSTGPQLMLTDGLANSLPFTFRQAGSTLYIATSSQTTFATSTNSIITVDGTTGSTTFSGFVGIGTSNPAALLHTSSLLAQAYVASSGSFADPFLGGTAVEGLRVANSSVFTGDAVGINFVTGASPVMGSSYIVGIREAGNKGGLAFGNRITSSSYAEAMRITSFGAVGIGTTTPRWALQVASSTGPQLTLSDSNSLTTNHVSFRNAGGNLYIATSSASTFATSTNTLLTINGTSGNVGIGATNSVAKLTVTGTGSSSATSGFIVENSAGTDAFAVRDDGATAVGQASVSLTTNSVYSNLFLGADFSGTQIITNNSGNGISAAVSGVGNEVRFAGSQEFSNGFGANFTAASTNTNAGNILTGIKGTATVQAASGRAITMIGGNFNATTNDATGGTFTTVAGARSTAAIGQSGATATNVYGLQISDFSIAGTATNTYGIHIGDVTSGTQSNQAYGLFQSDAGARNYFAGSLGVGVTNPSQQLSVAQGVAFLGVANGAGTAYLCTTLATGVVSTSTTACNPSSLRYKDNVEDLSYGLAQVMNLRPVSFDYKPELLVPGHQIGFIAEEVDQIIPEVVGHDSEGRADNVDYAKLTSLLAKAIQEVASITGIFRDNLITWLGDATNGVQDFFANRVHTKELCVGDGSSETCVNKAQLDSLLAGAGMSGTQVVSGGSGGGDETDMGDIEIIPPSDDSGSSASSTPDTIDTGGDASSTPETVTSDNTSGT